MRVAQILVCPVFLWFAYLQWNDPDALLWIAAYGLLGTSCACAAFNRTSTAASLVLAAVLVAWAAVLSMDASEQLAQPDGPSLVESELTREVAGLMLGAFWSAVTGLHAIRRRWKEKK